ncbi:MAG: type II toxin-antitoxin system VapC family toxin [Candidatus Acidiferrum sp.]
MSGFVLDASLTAAWFIPDPETDYALNVRSRLAVGSTALVPSIWAFEMANTLVKAVRIGTLTEEAVEYGLQQLEILVISGSRISVDSNLRSVREAYAVARRYQVSAYDGFYLQLAIDAGLPLATLDKGLQAAAVKAGVTLLK